MAVFKIEKQKNYTVMSNYHLRDQNLSLKAKGSLSFMLSLPEDWDYSLNGLCAICKEQETAIKNTLKELKDNGYLAIDKVRGDKGYFEYVYNIYEQPLEITQEKNPGVENPPMEYPQLENQPQINTNKQSIKEQTKQGIQVFTSEDRMYISTSSAYAMGLIDAENFNSTTRNLYEINENIFNYINNKYSVEYEDLQKRSGLKR